MAKKIASLFIGLILAFAVFITICSVVAADSSWRLNPDVDYLVVVNQNNPYDFDSESAQAARKSMIKTYDVGDRDEIYVERATYLAFTQMQQYLMNEGFFVGIYDAYRSYETAEEIAEYWSYGHVAELREEAMETYDVKEADRLLALADSIEGWIEMNPVGQPGYTEHHTGMLLNVWIWYDDEWYTETEERQNSIDYFKRLHEVMPDFGFIDRFPAGKEDYTGVGCEPYEIRFVGSSEIAHMIMDNGLCLEEYLGMDPIVPDAVEKEPEIPDAIEEDLDIPDTTEAVFESMPEVEPQKNPDDMPEADAAYGW
ncbi:D-alanyl-D-alanine carboxypeptidase family protein [Candidatus Saccharibacteria bacterium]|nr:D-alanyl-D-alanine carboxypeptidase family protein [Candidatus Saccharibacteria bacterium]